jgi:hypothetical protein
MIDLPIFSCSAGPAAASNLNTYFNTKLNAAFPGSNSAIQVWDIRAADLTLFADPVPYGIWNLGGITSGGNDLPDQFASYDGLHPSAAHHRYHSLNAIGPICAFAGTSPQTVTALQKLNISPLLPAPLWSTGSGGTVPNFVTYQDPRMARTLNLVTPFITKRCNTDFDEGVLPSATGPKYFWNTQLTGGAAMYDYDGTGVFTNSSGLIFFLTNTIGDIAGAMARVPFNVGNSGLTGIDQTFRVGYNYAAGNQFLMQFGLGDSLTSLANGLFIEIEISTSGVKTGNLVSLSSGTRTALPFTVSSSWTPTVLLNFRCQTDNDNRRAQITSGGVSAGFIDLNVAPTNYWLYPFLQSYSQVSPGSGAIYIDGINVEQDVPRL